MNVIVRSIIYAVWAIIAAFWIGVAAWMLSAPVHAQTQDLPYNDNGVRRQTTPVYLVDPALGVALRPGAAPRYAPLGYCQLTSVAASTALAACAGGVPATATVAQLCVEVQAVRYRDDGVAPTAAIGMPAAAGVCFPISGNLSAIRFIQVTAGAIVNVSFYR